MTKAERTRSIELTNYTPYLTFMDELGMFGVSIVEKLNSPYWNYTDYSV